MSKTVKLRKGFDINLAGKASQNVVENVGVTTYSVKPTDFVGYVKPKLLVKEGDTVKAGTPLFYDKSRENMMFTSPVSGEVVEIKRGEKRKLLEIKVLADQEIQYEEFSKYTVSEVSNLSEEVIKDTLQKGGVWPHIIQRPFAVIANPDDKPKAIYISGFDSSPLAPDYDILFKGEEQYFVAGVDILKKLTSGNVNLNISSDKEVSKVFGAAKNITTNKFSGPHPAGNVGVQIHHIDPINKGDIVWTVSAYGVIQIGKLFVEGRYDASKIIALTGSEVQNPQYYKVKQGASIKALIENNLKSENVRIISGNVLSGQKINHDEAFGFYHQQITVIPDGDDYRFFGSFAPTADRVTTQRAIGLLTFLNKLINPNKEYIVDANINGEHRPFIQSGHLEKMLPMDIYPTYLLKSILNQDFEEMEALGIYEVAEEDFALCEFADVSKHPIQSMIREGLTLMQNS